MYQDAYETIQTLFTSKFIRKITFHKSGEIKVFFLKDDFSQRFSNMIDILETLEKYESGDLK